MESVNASSPFRVYKITIAILALVLLCVAAGFAWYFTHSIVVKADTHSRAEERSQVILSVARHVIIPEDEEPIFATVTDPKQLQGQVFFENAQVGDKVLIFSHAHRAMLYRPSVDRIVEMAPYNEPKE